jgi:hypothetical protein
MSKKVRVAKIVIEIGDKRIALSLKEAESLKEVLDDMFGEDVVIYKDRWCDYRPYIYTSPTYCWPNQTDIICKTTTAGQMGEIHTDTVMWNASMEGNTLSLAAAA